MRESINRIKSIKNSRSASLAVGLSTPLVAGSGSESSQGSNVKVGIIGTGGRGTHLMSAIVELSEQVLTITLKNLFCNESPRRKQRGDSLSGWRDVKLNCYMTDI